jgi:MalT-like TPR region
VLLAEQEPGQALGLLARLHDLAASQGRAGSVLEIRALQALGLAAAGDQQGALAALAEALALAGPESYVPVFVDEGVPWLRCSASSPWPWPWPRARSWPPPRHSDPTMNAQRAWSGPRTATVAKEKDDDLGSRPVRRRLPSRGAG